MATSFSMDTIGFLQAINKLERRFEELVSPETMRKVCEDYDRDGTPTPWDHRLYALARDVFRVRQLDDRTCARRRCQFDGRLVASAGGSFTAAPKRCASTASRCGCTSC